MRLIMLYIIIFLFWSLSVLHPRVQCLSLTLCAHRQQFHKPRSPSPLGISLKVTSGPFGFTIRIVVLGSRSYNVELVFLSQLIQSGPLECWSISQLFKKYTGCGVDSFHTRTFICSVSHRPELPEETHG